MERNITFEIEKHIGVIWKSERTGWQRELNIVNWNGNGPKYDIREWDPSHEKMSRGITLTEDEARKLCILLEEHLPL